MYTVETVDRRNKGRRGRRTSAELTTHTPNESLFSEGDDEEEDGERNAAVQTETVRSVITRPSESYTQQQESVLTQTV